MRKKKCCKCESLINNFCIDVIPAILEHKQLDFFSQLKALFDFFHALICCNKTLLSCFCFFFVLTVAVRYYIADEQSGKLKSRSMLRFSLKSNFSFCSAFYKRFFLEGSLIQIHNACAWRASKEKQMVNENISGSILRKGFDLNNDNKHWSDLNDDSKNGLI